MQSPQNLTIRFTTRPNLRESVDAKWTQRKLRIPTDLWYSTYSRKQ